MKSFFVRARHVKRSGVACLARRQRHAWDGCYDAGRQAGSRRRRERPKRSGLRTSPNSKVWETQRPRLILAAFEFARRRIKADGAKIETPADLLPHVRHYADRKQEHFLCASINGANEIINIRVVSIGLIDRTPVHPREVFADALIDRAAAIIVAHNHPNGSLEPSANDLDVTKQLKGAGEVVGISLLDHIIFNRSSYFSLLENGLL